MVSFCFRVMSDQEERRFSFGSGASSFRGVVYHNEFKPSSDSRNRSPKCSRRRGTISDSARSKLSNFNPPSNRSSRLLKDPLPPITRQSSVISSSSEVSPEARSRHCGRLNYPVFKAPCFEHSTDKKPRTFNIDEPDAKHSVESQTSTKLKGKISPSGNNSNRTGSSPINFSLLYGKVNSRKTSSPKYAGQDDESYSSESSLSIKVADKNDDVQVPQEINPNFRSFWDLTGMYQAGDSNNTGALQVLSLGMPQSAGGKSDADSLLDSTRMDCSARMRRREKTGGSFSTVISQSACTSSVYSPYALSPKPGSHTMGSATSPCGVGFDTASSKSNDSDNGAQMQQAHQELKQNEKKQANFKENIDEVLQSYRSVNSEVRKDTRRFSRDAFRDRDSSPSYGDADTIDSFVVAADIHPELTQRSLRSSSVFTARSNLLSDESSKKDASKRSIRQHTSRSQYPSSPDKIQSLSTSSDGARSLPTSFHRKINEKTKVTEIPDVQSPRAGRQSEVKMHMQSLQISPKTMNFLGSGLKEEEEYQERKPLAQSARYVDERSPRLCIKKPEVLSAKFPPYWPEVRAQISFPSVRKDSSPESVSSQSISPSPQSCKDDQNSSPNTQSKRKIKVPNFPRSLDNSPKEPCPLTGRSLLIQKLKPCVSLPLTSRSKTQSCTDSPQDPNPFDLRLNLPPSPSLAPSPPRLDTEEEMYVFPPDPNWVRFEPYPGCVQYCPVDKQHTDQIVAHFQESGQQRSPVSSLKSSGNSKSPPKEVDDVSERPEIVKSVSQYERSSKVFQQENYNKQASSVSQPASVESRSKSQKTSPTWLKTKQEDFKVANAWFENEISEPAMDSLAGRNWREDTHFQSRTSPVNVARAVAASAPVEDSPRAPSHVSYDSTERDYGQDNISLETTSENQGICSWLAKLCPKWSRTRD